MKRSAACLALVASLALAAGASGAVYAGTGASDTKMKVFFGVKKRQGQPKKVRAFTAFSVPIACSDGSRGRTADSLPIEFPRRMKVNERRRFRGTERFTVRSTKRRYRVKMSVRGKLRRRGTAKGVVAISGRGRRSGVTCRSGDVPWVAARVRKA